ncbi:helix-turn-helix domain-containing protein [Dactylosporangium sp. NPDC051485]|uniref:helix-turn-helix domain-containing protein n=1 Tax=Dactylosporangium sp. NPDC051485 TaxID=3154846 RepID=UPI003422C8B3
MPEPEFEDLTARARIRDAAIALFAERGAGATTVRDIAEQAGVSPGLLRHHFGSKEALREACDAYVLDRLVQIKEKMLFDNPGFLPAVHPTVVRYNKYVTRALLDGSPSAAAMFDDMVRLSADWIEQHIPGLTKDYHSYAAVFTGMQSGLLAMHEHVSRALGADMFTPEGHVRLAAALIDFYSHPLLTPDLAAKVQSALDALRAKAEGA